MTVEIENEVMGPGAFFWVLREDTELCFVRGDVETPGEEPLVNVVNGSLEVGYEPKAFAAPSARKRAVDVGIISKLRARNVFGNVNGEVQNEDGEESGAENPSLRDSIGHGNRGTADTVVSDLGGAILEVISQP